MQNQKGRRWVARQRLLPFQWLRLAAVSQNVACKLVDQVSFSWRRLSKTTAVISARTAGLYFETQRLIILYIGL